ncbi:hypothetical protein [Streptomyces sp. UG1]
MHPSDRGGNRKGRHQVYVGDSLLDAHRLAELFASEHVRILTASAREALD